MLTRESQRHINGIWLDEQIFNKMSKGYGNKYNKKIIKKIQQNHPESKHLLFISPQVLAYSFQYLSFKESSKIESVCSYFTYINTKYEALSHFYINLNHIPLIYLCDSLVSIMYALQNPSLPIYSYFSYKQRIY